MLAVEVRRHSGITEQTFSIGRSSTLIWRSIGFGREAAAGGKWEAEGAADRAKSGQGHAPGCTSKDIPKYWRRRSVVDYLCQISSELEPGVPRFSCAASWWLNRTGTGC
jgi:hypothetical protein